MDFNDNDAFIMAGIASINNFLRRIEFLLCSSLITNLIAENKMETLKKFREEYKDFQEKTPVHAFYVQPEKGE